jgi:hypothetical protein
VRVSKGAAFRVHEESGSVRIELIKGPARVGVSCRGKRIEVAVDTTVMAIPFEEGETSRVSEADVYVDAAGTMRLSVISAAARVSGAAIQPPEQVHEGQQVIIPRGSCIQSQKNIVPEQLKWKE